jgi:multidrug efflux pump subunit AcrA (membrane-fusion protein)
MSERHASQVIKVAKVAIARLRFVAVFILAAAIVGYWDDLKNRVDRWTRPAIAPDSLSATAAGSTEFFCPMHPDVIRQEAGQCPKCGMPLVKRMKGHSVQLPDDVMARVQLTPQRVSLANVQTTSVEFRTLVRDIHALGLLDYDETKLARLSARVAGRVDELYVTYAGQAIHRGDPVYSLYSPEVYTAQREYLMARKRVEELPKEAGPDSKTDASAVYNASLQKLVLWGVGTDDLDRLDEEYDKSGKVPTNLTVTSPISGIVVRKEVTQGQYLQAGDAPFIVADLSVLWLKAKIFEQDVALVNVGDAADVRIESMPGQTFGGTVSFKAFQLDPETRTVDARVLMANPGLTLRPGMFAEVSLHIPVSSPASQPTTWPTSRPAMMPATAPMDLSRIYWTALQPYFKAHALLSKDKADGVGALLAESMKLLTPLREVADLRAELQRLSDAISRTPGQSLVDLRITWKDISSAMSEIGRSVGTPSDAPAVKVFRCPMKKALWLQQGDQTENPYYGSEMYTCGSAVESLPKYRVGPTTQRSAAVMGTVLAVPRSAVIDTGGDQIVYVESSAGIYDMKKVKLGAIAGDYFPVLAGLEEGDRVVTVGTFLIDAENRLNPTRLAPTMGAEGHDHAAMGNHP